MESKTGSAYDSLVVPKGNTAMTDLSNYTTQIDICAAESETAQGMPLDTNQNECVRLLQTMVGLQQKNCELLSELINQVSHQQKQRTAEIKAWREANPELAISCRYAAESLSKVHTEFLASVAQEAFENAEDFTDSEYALGEFIDRFGPRLAHFNGVLQLLGQLSAPPPKPHSSNNT
ncbi:MAG: hypothetical protein ABGW78_12400 [Pirellulales bacterium]